MADPLIDPSPHFPRWCRCQDLTTFIDYGGDERARMGGPVFWARRDAAGIWTYPDAHLIGAWEKVSLSREEHASLIEALDEVDRHWHPIVARDLAREAEWLAARRPFLLAWQRARIATRH